MIPFSDEREEIIEESLEGAEVFTEELSLISDVKLRSVTIKIIKEIFEQTKPNRHVIANTKKVVKIARAIASGRGYTNLALDVLTAAGVLHELYIKKHGELHTIYVRLNHRETLNTLEPAIAEQLCQIIEGHHGFNSIIPAIASREGSMPQILTDAVVMAELDF